MNNEIGFCGRKLNANMILPTVVFEELFIVS